MPQNVLCHIRNHLLYVYRTHYGIANTCPQWEMFSKHIIKSNCFSSQNLREREIIFFITLKNKVSHLWWLDTKFAMSSHRNNLHHTRSKCLHVSSLFINTQQQHTPMKQSTTHGRAKKLVIDSLLSFLLPEACLLRFAWLGSWVLTAFRLLLSCGGCATHTLIVPPIPSGLHSHASQ